MSTTSLTAFALNKPDGGHCHGRVIARLLASGRVLELYIGGNDADAWSRITRCEAEGQGRTLILYCESGLGYRVKTSDPVRCRDITPAENAGPEGT